MSEIVPLAGVLLANDAASAAIDPWLGSTYWPDAFCSSA